MPELSHTISLTVSYNGAAYAGFARQPDQPTVQGELEHALLVVLHRQVDTTCAGRTDAGVHALGQIVTFDVDDEEYELVSARDFTRFKRSLNAITLNDIAIRAVEERAFGFSARFDAQAREYRYFLTCGDVLPVFMRDFSWHVPGQLDLESMRRAAQCLIGEHDFKSFCRASSAIDKPTCRNLMEVAISPDQVLGEDVIVVRVVGSSFLHSMVRTIVGSLVMIGKGQRDEAWLAEALAACDRSASGETAPARGLVFWHVTY